MISRQISRASVSCVLLFVIVMAVPVARAQPPPQHLNLNPSGSSGWTFVQPMPTRRYGLTAVTGSDGRIYAIGGGNGGSTLNLNVVEVYDPHADSWTTAKNMQTPRWAPGAAISPDGKIYVVGGDTGGSNNVAVDATEAYDPTSDTWTTLAPMPTPRWGLTLVNGPNGLYAIGGASGCVWPCLSVLKTVELYNPSTNTWQPMADLPVALGYMQAVEGRDNKIYVFGGQGSDQHMVSTVEVYTSTTNKWNYVNTNMPVPLASFGLVLGKDGIIYVIGGDGDCPPYFSCPTTAVASYNTITNSWNTNLPSLNTPRHGLGATIGSDGIIYAIGGCQGGYDCTVNTVEAYTPTITSPPDYQLSTNSSMITISQGESTILEVQAYAYGTYSLPVTLSASTSASGLSTLFSGTPPTTIIPTLQGASTSLNVSASSDASPGQWYVTITGQDSQGRYRQVTIAVQVNKFAPAITISSLSTDKASYNAFDTVVFTFTLTVESGPPVSQEAKPIVEVLDVGSWQGDDVNLGVASQEVSIIVNPPQTGWPSGTKTWGVIIEGPPPSYTNVYYDKAIESTFEDAQSSYKIQISAFAASDEPLGVGITGTEIFIGTSSTVFRRYVTDSWGAVAASVPANAGSTYSILAGVYAWGLARHSPPADGFVFDHWVSSGGVSTASDSASSTEITVAGDGSLRAIFVRIHVDTFSVDQQGSILPLASNSGVTLTFGASVNWADEYLPGCKYCGSRTVYVRAVIQGWGSDGKYDSWYLPTQGAEQVTLGSGTYTFPTWSVSTYEQVTPRPLPGTYNVGLLIFDNNQIQLGNLPTNGPIGGKTIEFAFALDDPSASYTEIYGTSERRIIHMHFASNDVCQNSVCPTTIASLMQRVGQVDWAFTIGAFVAGIGAASAASKVAQLKVDFRDLILNVLSKELGQTPKLNSDKSYDIVIYQTIDGSYKGGTYYEAALPRAVQLHQTDIFFTTLGAEIGVISIASLLLAIPTLGISLAITGGIMLAGLAWSAIEHTMSIPGALFNGKFANIPSYGCYSGACQTQNAPEFRASSLPTLSSAQHGDSSQSSSPYGPDGNPFSGIVLDSISPQNITLDRGASATINVTYHAANHNVTGEDVQLMLLNSWSGWPPMNYTGIDGGSIANEASASVTVSLPQRPGTYYAWFVAGSGSTFSAAVQGFVFDLLAVSPPHLIFTIPAHSVNITVTSSPEGNGIIDVDGIPTNTPRTFSWDEESIHTLSASSFAACGTGCRLGFGNWSDYGYQNHTIVVAESQQTYEATYDSLEYLLTASGTPRNGGGVTPNFLWQTPGSRITILATPQTGFGFSRWTGTGNGSYTGSNNPSNVFMNGPITETAIFASVNTQQIAIRLNRGWNLISLPIVPKSTSITYVLKSQVAAQEVTVVWSYSGTPRTWQSFVPGKGGPLTTMTDGNAYWIFMKTNDTLYVDGNVIAPGTAPSTYPLITGWNLVGYKPQPTVQSEGVNQYLSSITGKYDPNNVWVYTSNGWVRAEPSYTLQPGQGMWILMTAPATLRP